MIKLDEYKYTIIMTSEANCFTDKQQNVLIRLANGFTRKNIAKDDGTSLEAVKKHVGNMMEAMDVSHETGLISKCIRSGILTTHLTPK